MKEYIRACKSKTKRHTKRSHAAIAHFTQKAKRAVSQPRTVSAK